MKHPTEMAAPGFGDASFDWDAGKKRGAWRLNEAPIDASKELIKLCAEAIRRSIWVINMPKRIRTNGRKLADAHDLLERVLDTAAIRKLLSSDDFSKLTAARDVLQTLALQMALELKD